MKANAGFYFTNAKFYVRGLLQENSSLPIFKF